MAEASAAKRTVIVQDDSLRTLGGFTQIPNVVLKHPTVSDGSKITYGVLLSYAWQDDFCFPAQERLARDMNRSIRQVQRFLIELKAEGLVDWRQQGLNRPNVYYILPISSWSGPNPLKNKDTTNVSSPDTTDLSPPDATETSPQDTTPVSYKEDSGKKTHKVVNALTDNDPRISDRSRRPSAGKPEPTISNRALQSRYRFTDAEIDRVHYLVDKQVQILGAEGRNHAAYVKRASEAVAEGNADLLDIKLSELKQVASTLTIRSRPAFFYQMWKEALAKERSRPPVLPKEQGDHSAVARRSEPVRLAVVGTLKSVDRPKADAEETRTRFLAEAEKQRFSVPDYIRDGDVAELKRWYGRQLVAAAEKKGSPTE